MDLAQRLAYRTLLVSLKRSGVIDKRVLRTIAEGLRASSDSLRSCDGRSADELMMLAKSLEPAMGGSYCCAAQPAEVAARTTERLDA